MVHSSSVHPEPSDDLSNGATAKASSDRAELDLRRADPRMGRFASCTVRCFLDLRRIFANPERRGISRPPR